MASASSALTAAGVVPDDQTSDRALAACVAAGDEAAARRLFDTHVRMVHRLAYRLTGSAADADDATQETFARAIHRIGQYRGDVPIGAWLRAVAMSVTLNARRKRNRVRGHEMPADALALEAHVRSDAPADLRLRLARAMDLLTEDERTIVILHDVEGYTHVEIAETLGIAAGTSRARLTGARRSLRRLLDGESLHG